MNRHIVSTKYAIERRASIQVSLFSQGWMCVRGENCMPYIFTHGQKSSSNNAQSRDVLDTISFLLLVRTIKKSSTYRCFVRIYKSHLHQSWQLFCVGMLKATRPTRAVPHRTTQWNLNWPYKAIHLSSELMTHFTHVFSPSCTTVHPLTSRWRLKDDKES